MAFLTKDLRKDEPYEVHRKIKRGCFRRQKRRQAWQRNNNKRKRQEE